MLDAAFPKHVPGAKTPTRLFLHGHARERFAAIACARERLSTGGIRVVIGYSVKTNPRAEMLAYAREHGFFAEVISRDELRWAFDRGFPPERIIYNGPAPLNERPSRGRLAVAFADSVEAFRRQIAAGCALRQGVRIRPAPIRSRFGVPEEDTDALVAAIAELPRGSELAVSFHVRKDDFCGLTWRDVALLVMVRGAELERRSGVPVVAFDIGGGWEPAALDAALVSDGPWLLATLPGRLSQVREVVFEPGQSIATPVEALLTRVVEIRRRTQRCEIIVDAGYPDLPQMQTYAHRIFTARPNGWELLGRGRDRIAGRTCLEYDIIAADVALPEDMREGDDVLVADCGSYDASMAFRFARGGGHEEHLLVG